MEDYDLLENLRHKNSNLHILRIDMGSAESIKNAARAADASLLGSPLDMIISNAALMGKVNCSLYEPPMDLDAVWRAFNVNAVGPLRLVEAFLPLMDAAMDAAMDADEGAKGFELSSPLEPEGQPRRGQFKALRPLTCSGMKRLCFVSSEVSCITLMKNRYNDTFAYPMSKAGMNMGVRLLFNGLFPQGFTFRLFHPGWMKFREKDGTLSEHGKYDPDDIGKIAAGYFEKRILDEHRLVMVDYNGYEWPF
jgi:NAD(P)-dependent dehydrogenase (short-subunit alcohol dehydrogenase family)